jgi:DNA (cytosine-5)-methyltransferase 1
VRIVTGCSGVEGIGIAAQWAGMEIIGQIEIDEFCIKILEKYWPHVKRMKNLFNVKGDEFGTVDIFAFGDPCQPHSVAGKQKGTADERYIWPELFRIIQTMRPAWILNENVVGSVSNGVVRDKILQLESEGYWAQAFTLPACATGAPHERQRVVIVAYSIDRGPQIGRPECYESMGRCGTEWEKTGFHISEVAKSSVMGDTECIGCAGQLGRRTDKEPADGYSGIEAMADTSSPGRKECDTSRITAGQGHNTGCGNEARSDRAAQSRLGGDFNGTSSGLYEPGGHENGSGIFTAFEAIFTATLDQILWPAGYGAEQYDYEPPRVATGVKNRTNRLKALGNSIVWQQIFSFLLAIKLINERLKVR